MNAINMGMLEARIDGHHKEIHRRLGDLESHRSTQEALTYNRINAQSQRIDKLQKQVSTVAIALDMARDHTKETDTAFSDTLKSYLGRLEKAEAKIDVVAAQEPYEELHDRLDVLIERVDCGRVNMTEHLKKHKRQEDDQPGGGE